MNKTSTMCNLSFGIITIVGADLFVYPYITFSMLKKIVGATGRLPLDRWNLGNTIFGVCSHQRYSSRLDIGCLPDIRCLGNLLFAVGEGLEPPQAFARRFSRPLHYHYANPPAYLPAKLMNFIESNMKPKTC